MELLARLEHIELKITQIKEQNKKLITENEAKGKVKEIYEGKYIN